MMNKVLERVCTIVRNQVAETMSAHIPGPFHQLHMQQLQHPQQYQQANMVTSQMNPGLSPIAHEPPPYDLTNMIAPQAPLTIPQYQGVVHPPPQNNANPKGGFSNLNHQGRGGDYGRGGRGDRG